MKFGGEVRLGTSQLDCALAPKINDCTPLIDFAATSSSEATADVRAKLVLFIWLVELS